MKKNLLFLFIAVVVLIVLGFATLQFFQNRTKIPPDLQELMVIIKKSPDYPDFLEVIKAEDFDPKLVSYYNFSPKVYSEKSEEMASIKQAIDTIILNNNSFFVELQSKLNPEQGMIAIIDMAKKEPQIIIANLNIEVGIKN